jgi:hypothetical protein
MFGRQQSWDAKLRRSARIQHVQRELLEAMFGGVVGAVTGAVGGPPGVIAGGVIGFLVGLLSGAIAQQEERRRMLRERWLDEVGVTRVAPGSKSLRRAPALVHACAFPPVASRPSVHDTIPDRT